MIKVSITSTEVRRLTGNAKATGKPYDMAFQDAWMFLTDSKGQPDPYPTKIEVQLAKDEKDGAPLFYAPGDYQLHPSSIYVDRNGRLAVSPRLAKLAAPAPKSAA